MIRHLLNRDVTVYRMSASGNDGRGGRVTSLAPVGTYRARLSQPSAQERRVAGREGATLDYVVHTEWDVDVLRGDQLVVSGFDGRPLRVLAVVEDSSRTYRRLECQTVQAGSGA